MGTHGIYIEIPTEIRSQFHEIMENKWKFDGNSIFSLSFCRSSVEISMDIPWVPMEISPGSVYASEITLPFLSDSRLLHSTAANLQVFMVPSFVHLSSRPDSEQNVHTSMGDMRSVAIWLKLFFFLR